MTKQIDLDKLITVFAGLACFGLIAFYLYYFYQALSSGHYYPPRSDHVAYYMEIKSFLETGSLLAPISVDGNVAKLIGTGSHGFMYQLFYGLIAKVFGFNYMITIWTHFVLFIVMLFMIFKNQILSFEQKLMFVSVQLSFFIVFFSSFGHYPEFLHVFFANLMGLYLLNLYQKYKNDENVDILIYILLLMIFVFTIFRISWAFCAFGVIAFAKDKRDFVKYSIFAILFLIFAVFFRAYFYASYDDNAMGQASIAVDNGDFLKPLFIMFENLKETTFMYFYKYYFSLSNFTSKLFAFAAFLATLYYGIKKKNQLCLFVGITLGVFFIALFLTYDAFDGRDIKGLAAPYIMCLLALITLNKRIVLSVILLISLVALPESHKIFKYLIFEKCMASGQLFPKFNFEVLRRLSSHNDDVVKIVIEQESFSILMPGRPPHIKNVLHTPYLALPFKTNDGKRIRYLRLSDKNRKIDYVSKFGVDYEIDSKTGKLIDYSAALSQK